MSDKRLFNQVQRRFEVYDKPELLATTAALQLMPENASKAIRLETLSHIVASLSTRPDEQRLDLSSLQHALEMLDGFAYHVNEDPCNNLFTEELTFFGGGYVVFLGLDDSAAYTLKHLSRAIFQGSTRFPSSAFRREAHAIIGFALALSNEVARRAGIRRGLMPDQSTGEIAIPEPSRMDVLKAAVRFNRQEVNAIIERHNLDIDTDLPLTIRAGNVSLDEYQPGYGQLFVTPVVEYDDEIVLAVPGVLLSAARNAVIASAQRHGVVDELVSRFQISGWYECEEAFRIWGIQPLRSRQAEIPGIRLGYFGLDSDKLLVCLFVTDTLVGYDPSDPHGNVTERQANDWDGLIQLIEGLERQLYSGSQPPNDIFFVIVIQPIGTPLLAGLPGLAASELLAINAHDLETVSMLQHVDPLFLYKFALVLKEAEERAAIMAFSTLDLIYMYLRKRHSFYMSDDERPSAIHVTCDCAVELRAENFNKYDFHTVESFQGGYLEVVARWENSRIPIYFSPRLEEQQFALLVEGESNCWISGSMSDNNGPGEELRNIYVTLINALAYWIWRGQALISSLVGEGVRLHIQVFLPPTENWTTLDDLYEGPPVETTVSRRGDTLSIWATFHDNIYSLLHDEGNSGELEIVALLFEGIGVAGGFDGDIKSLVRSLSRSPYEKMFIAANIARTPDLIGAHLPRFRKVQDADQGRQLDRLGRYLIEERGWKVGPLTGGDKVKVLNDAVSYFYQHLVRMTGSSDSTELLWHAIAQHEAAIHAQAENRFHAPARIACFGDVQDIYEEFSKETRAHSRGAIACRFLIEYLASTPSAGLRPYSLSLYDDLLSYCSEIFNLGTQSDLIRHEIADLQMAILPSERLGTDRDAYEVAMTKFDRVFSKVEVDRATESFGRYWSNLEPGERPSLIDEMDEACREEFGLTLTEIAEVFGVAMHYALSLDTPVAVVSEEGFIGMLSEELGWEHAKSKVALDLLSLRPRADFLTPPEGFDPPDVWPWRFNRRLSYIRRPFVIHPGQDGSIVMWGARQVHQSSGYLFDLIWSGRLFAQSSRMTQFNSKMVNMKGREFNDEVADFVEVSTALQVKRNVKKFGKLQIRDERGDLGDIDVLLIDHQNKVLLAVETKDFSMAKTPWEMSQEMKKIFQSDKGASAIEKHLKRVNWLKEHLGSVLSELRVSDMEGWSVDGEVVIRQELVTPYLRDQAALPVTTFREFKRRWHQ